MVSLEGYHHNIQNFVKFEWKITSFCTTYRGESRGTQDNCVGEQNSNNLLRKTKLKAIFALLHKCSMYPKSTSGIANSLKATPLLTYYSIVEVARRYSEFRKIRMKNNQFFAPHKEQLKSYISIIRFQRLHASKIKKKFPVKILYRNG